MNVLSFQTPIAGRNADLLAFHTDTPFSATPVVEQLYDGKGGKACVGLQKLAQQVILRLYTPIGKKPYDATQGTQLVTEILLGRIKTVPDVRRSFAFARENLLDQFVADFIANSNIPLDEQLADVELVSASIRGDELSLTIKITSRAGIQAQFIAPINVT